MIKLKSFPIEKTEEANEFIASNPPRSTEKQSGIVFHNGNIIIIYDDHQENPLEKTDTFISLLSAKRKERMIAQHSMITAQIALDDMKPKGYSSKLSDTQIKKLLEEQGNGLLEYKDIKAVMEQMVNLENKILMSKHEIRRIDFEIKGYEKMLG